MPTPFQELLDKLQAAQGDTAKLALVTFDFAVKDDPALKAAAEAAAVPHWFDEQVLGALLPEQAGTADCLLESLKTLPMVETYPMEDRSPAWNLHEATRHALRRRMWETNLPRFLQLSQRAADHFGGIAGDLEKTKEGVEHRAAYRIEAISHRLLSEPGDGAYELGAFIGALFATHRLERLQAIAALVADLVEGPWPVCVSLHRSQDAKAWARAQCNLGAAMQEMGTRVEASLGNRLLAQAVTAYRAALEVYTRESLPQQWATTQNNLGNSLQEQAIRSEGAALLALLGEAVRAYRAALEVLTRESLPQQWAMTQNNLGLALQEQATRSEGAAVLALLGDAVRAFRAALEVRTRESLPQQWAGTQNNLGIALGAQGSRSEGAAGLALLGDAVRAFRAALEVYTRESLPQGWATMQNNLGNALWEQDSRSEGAAGLALLEEAVRAYRAALEVRTRESLPQDWAMTQNNLGGALMAQGDKAGAVAEKRRLYLEAEAAYVLALEVRTKETLPGGHQKTQGNLARVRARLKALE